MKKQRKFSLILLSFLIGAILLAPTVAATIYSVETFESDTVNTAPSDSWYTYTGIAWDYANVTDSAARFGSNSFLINDTITAATNRSYFNVTADDYDFFEFWLRIDNASNNETMVYLLDGSANTIARLEIVSINTNSSTTDNVCRFRNHTTTYFNRSITNNTWYRFRLIFNFSTNEMQGRLYSNTGTLLNNSWGLATDGSGEVSYSDFETFQINSSAGKKSFVYFDSLNMAWTYTNPNQATNDILVDSMVVLLTVAILLVIVTFAFTGQITPENLIYLAVVAIIGVITAMIISGI